MAVTIEGFLADWIVEFDDLISTFIQIEQNNAARLLTAETDIDTLQTPADGVPQPILNWLATHSLTEVDTTLGTTITDLQDDVTQAQDDIVTLTNDLAQETSDRTDADDTLQDNIDDLNATVITVNDNLIIEISGRATSEASISVQLDDLNGRIDDLSSEIDSEVINRTTDTTSLFQSVATLSDTLNTANAKIELLEGIGVDPEGALAAQIITVTSTANDAMALSTSEETARILADIAIQDSLDAVSDSVAAHTVAISEESADRIAADSSINSNLGSLTTLVGSHTSAITAETAARVAADSTLTGNVNTNTNYINALQSDLTTEISQRQSADNILQNNVTSLTNNVTSMVANVTTLQTQMTSARSKYSLLIDSFGYITGYKDIGAVQPAAEFFVRELNNNIQLQNPAYLTKYFPAVSVSAFSAPVTYDADWGGVTQNVFYGLDTIFHTRDVKIYSPGTVGLDGSIFLGANYSTGGHINRLGQTSTTFLAKISGTVNRYLSLWYRIKDLPEDTVGTWIPFVMADNTMAGARTYEQTSAQAAVTITVPATQVIEFGVTVLNIEDATLADTALDTMYGVNVSIEAFNLVSV